MVVPLVVTVCFFLLLAGGGTEATARNSLAVYGKSSTSAVYVSRIFEGQVIAIDTTTDRVIRVLETGTTPAEIASVASIAQVYVADIGDGTVSVIDTMTHSVNQTVSLGYPVASIQAHQTNGMLYVLEFSNGEPGTRLFVVDSAAPSDFDTYTIGSRLQNIVVDSVNNRAYATDFGAGVIVIDTTDNSVVTTIPLGGEPHGVAVHESTARLYVTQLANDTVSVISTRNFAVIDTLDVGDTPQSIGLDRPRYRAFVTNEIDGTVSVIDTVNNLVLTDTITVGASPLTMSISEAAAKAYVYNSGDGTISVINTLTETVSMTLDVLFWDGFESGNTAGWATQF
jgi:YVTN family beta-propeller protein